MRRLLIASGVVLVVLAVAAVAALAIVPRLVDWQRYRPEIAARFHTATGLTLAIRGPIGLSLLPLPQLRLAQLTIADPRNPAAAPILRVAALAIELAPAALLDGRIEARSVTLDEPVLRLDRLVAARVDWRRAAADRADIWPVGIDRLAITGGRIVDPAGGAAARLDDIAATASLPGLDAPLHLDATLRWRGRDLAVTASADPPDADGRPVELTLGDAAATLHVTGIAQDGVRFAGRLHLAGASLRAFAAAFAPRFAAAAPPRAFSLGAKLAADIPGRQVAATEVAVDGLSASGSATLAFAATPEIGLRISVPQLGLGGGFGAMMAALGKVRLPGGWHGRLDAAVDAALWRGDAARRIRARVTFADGTLALRRFTALLPGGGEITASGTLRGDRRIEGTVALSADNLRGLLGWLGIPVTGAPADHLRRARLTARVASGVGGTIVLAPLTLDLDDSAITGSLHLTPGTHPAIDAALQVDRLDPGSYLPRDAGVATLAAVLAALRPLDAALDLRVATLVVGGRPLQQVHLAATARDGAVTIADLRATGLGGASAHFSGTLVSGTLVSGALAERGSGTPVLAGTFDCKGADMQPVLLQLFPGWTGVAATGPFALSGNVTIDRKTIASTARLAVLGGSAKFDGSIGLAQPGTLAGRIRLAYPHYAALVRALTGGGAGETGAVGIDVRVSGSARRMVFDPLTIAVGTQKLAGTATLTLGAPPHLAATLSGGDLALDRLLPAGGLALTAPPPLDAAVTLAANHLVYAGWTLAEPVLTLSANAGGFAVHATNGGLLGGTLSGTATYAPVGAPAGEGRLTLALHLDDARLDGLLAAAAGGPIITGRGAATLSATARGGSVAALIGSLTGTAALRTRDGTLSGIDLKSIAAAIAAGTPPAAGGDTPLTTLRGDFTIAGGVARSQNLQLALAGGSGRGTATVDLPNRQLSAGLVLRLAAAPAAPPVLLLLAGPLQQPRRTVDLTTLAAYAKGRQPALP